MYLIPADVHTKRIIRFTVTSQFTTAEDILRDWSIISKTASALLSESQSLSSSHQSKPSEDNVVGAEENQDPDLEPEDEDEDEDAAFRLDKAPVELWIDKVWTRPWRPTRSLSCSSEPLPCIHNGPQPRCHLGTRPPALRDVEADEDSPLTPGSTGGPLVQISEMPSELLGKQAQKKLTKFYSVPSFCNQWVQCGGHSLCCPLKASQPHKHLSPTCRTTCVSSSPAANTDPPPPLDAATEPELL